jgi:IMP dehydrogenase
MNSLDTIPITKVWLDADQSIGTAKLLLEGYRLPAIGVVNQNREFVGLLLAETIKKEPAELPLSSAELYTSPVLELRQNIREVAKILIEAEVDFLPVADGGKYLGLVTARGLLGKLRESFDPMTGLPWSDTLREWSQAKLENGVEIAMIFIDLDKFGKFNKEYGHVVGDKVLKKLVQYVSEKIDPKKDLFVRYGGDEFAIGTTREREDAEHLIELLEDGHRGLTIPEAPIPIHFSIGLFGGQRAQPRANTHVPSNVDNLVNLASRDCQMRKIASGKQANLDRIESENEVDGHDQIQSEEGSSTNVNPVESIRPPKGTVVLETVQVDPDENSLTYVVLRLNDAQHVGVGLKMGRTDAESVALATAKALERAFPQDSVQIESLEVLRAGSTELVKLRSTVTSNGTEHEVETEAEANGDLFMTVAHAVISAHQAV